MGVGEWYEEKELVQKEYDYNRITSDIYENRTKYAIGMIYKWGNSSDKEAAEKMAKAHGYKMQELINLVN